MRGAAPVGRLQDLEPMEASVVLYLRTWMQGPQGRALVARDLIGGLGEAQGLPVSAAFDHLGELCLHHGRRPLMTHNTRCSCIGADEACFANFIASAAEGHDEDAMLMATLLVRSDYAPMLTHLARDVGIALSGMVQRTHPDLEHTTQKTMH